MKQLKREGKLKQTAHKPPIADADLEKLKLHFQELGASSPIDLTEQVTVWFWLTYHLSLSLRGREVQVCLKKTDLSLCADASGEYFTLTVDFASKNHQGGIQYTEVSNGRVQDPQQVAAIKLLLSKLNAKNDHLFQRANISFAKDNVWFHNIPLGKNVLGTMMVRISEKVGLSQNYTNHSVRATAISKLSANGVEDRHIMAITGHRNAASLTSYCKPTSSQRAEMAAILDGKNVPSSRSNQVALRATSSHRPTLHSIDVTPRLELSCEFDDIDQALEAASEEDLKNLMRPQPASASNTMPINFSGASFQNCTFNFNSS